MEMADYLRFVFAFAFVVAAILILAFVAKRYGMGYRNVPKGLHRRLTISEIMPLDSKRKLVLVRRDDQEHLLLIGGESDLLVEKNISTDDKSFTEHLKTPPGVEPETLVAHDERQTNS